MIMAKAIALIRKLRAAQPLWPNYTSSVNFSTRPFLLLNNGAC